MISYGAPDPRPDWWTPQARLSNDSRPIDSFTGLFNWWSTIGRHCSMLDVRMGRTASAHTGKERAHTMGCGEMALAPHEWTASPCSSIHNYRTCIGNRAIKARKIKSAFAKITRLSDKATKRIEIVWLLRSGGQYSGSSIAVRHAIQRSENL